MAPKARESTTALAIIPTEEQTFNEVAPFGGQEFPVDGKLRQTTVTLDELGRSDNSFAPDGDPESTDLTHPQALMETYRPTRSQALLPKGVSDPRVSVMARIADIECSNSIREEAQTVRHKIAIVDEALTTAELVMAEDVATKKKLGRVSTYESLIGKPRDAAFVWKFDRMRSRFDGQLGAWVLASVLMPDAHPEDLYVEIAEPVKGTESAKDHFKYNSAFIDSMVMLEGEKELPAEYKKLRDPNSALSRQWLRGLARSYLEPGWNYNSSEAHIPAGSEGSKPKSLTDEAKGAITKTRRLISDHQGSIAEPLRVFLRMLALNQEFDELRAARPKAKAEIEAQRNRAWQSMLAVQVYLDGLAGIETIDRDHAVFAQEHQGDFTMQMAPSTRFEIITLDDIDAKIVAAAKDALTKKSAYDTVDRDREVLEELIAHLGTESRGRQNTLIIRTIGKSTSLRILHSLDPNSTKGEIAQGYMFDGTGMPQYADGHYADELVTSQVNPPKNSPYFRTQGNAVSGNMVAFDLITPERVQDPTVQERDYDRFMVTSGKLGHYCITKEILDIYNKPQWTPEDVKTLVGGGVEYTGVVIKPRIQTWRVVVSDTQARRMRMHKERYQNGDSFAIAHDANGNVYDDSGKIKGQGPQVRMFGMPRDKRREKKFARPVYRSPATGNLPVYLDKDRKQIALDNDGKPRTVNNILVEALFVNNGVRITDTPSKAASVMVTKHIRGLRKVEVRKGLLGRKKAS